VKLTAEQCAVARAILTEATDSFVRLAEIAKLDKKTAFQQADLRGVDFASDDIAGFAFTGADLRGADLSRARGKDQAIFTGDQVDAATRGLPLNAPADPDIARAHAMILAGERPPASWWPFMTELRFAETQLASLAPLAGLTALQYLGLSGTQVGDVTPLAGLTALEYLYLGDTQVSDVTPLALIKGLRILGFTKKKGKRPIRAALQTLIGRRG